MTLEHSFADADAEAADIAAQHAALAAVRLEAAGARLHDTEQRQLGQILIDDARRRAELDIQRAQAGALLAIAHGLEALRAEMVETRDVIDNALFDIANPLAPPPRWWQWRRCWTLWRQRAAFDAAIDTAQGNLLAKLDATFDVEAGLADVYARAGQTQPHESTAEVAEFLVEVRRQEDPRVGPQEVLGRVRFHAEYQAACDTAGTMLPGLCAQLGVPADPDQVYGRVSRCDPDGGEVCYIGAVFLPGATVQNPPAGGF